VCGDSWGSAALPIIEEEPLTGLYFYIVFASIVLAATNLILAVIVDAAQEAREISASDQMTAARMREMKELRTSLALLLSKMGTDSPTSGKCGLTVEDIRRGYDEIPEFGNALKVLGIQDSDIDQLFAVMDIDGSGSVSLEEFCNECLQLTNHDVRSLFLHTRIAMSAMNKRIEDKVGMLLTEVKELQKEVLSNIGGLKDEAERVHSFVEGAAPEITTVDIDTRRDAVRAGKDCNTGDIDFGVVAVMEKDIEDMLADVGEVNRWTEDQRDINEACQQLLEKLSDISSACGTKVQALQALIEEHHTKYNCKRSNFSMQQPIPLQPLKSMFEAVEVLAMSVSSVRPLRGTVVLV
jgi:hypothetical protein